jgi:sugar lactone lactonase YvrE
VLLGVGNSLLLAPTQASASPSGPGPFAPGSVVVSQGGEIFGGVISSGTGVEANGEVVVYPPGANGNVAPEASFTNGMYGPTTLAFDPWGDLWVANENTSDLVELTRSQLAMPDPFPAVTISAAPGALVNPFGLAFDRAGNLWVVGDGAGKVYEYTRWQLARSGSPTPRTTITNFPGIPFSDAFDAAGDLWVSTQVSSACPQGCVVEFSRAELALPDPAPTVTISSTGGAGLIFTPSGDLWMVTGGGPDSFGTPGTNDLVEFTRPQLSTSGPTPPALTISSANVGAYQSLDGPYAVAVNPSGDLWVSNFDGMTAVQYGRHQLFEPGPTVPQRAIFGPNTGMNWTSFVVIEA